MVEFPFHSYVQFDFTNILWKHFNARHGAFLILIILTITPQCCFQFGPIFQKRKQRLHVANLSEVTYIVSGRFGYRSVCLGKKRGICIKLKFEYNIELKTSVAMMQQPWRARKFLCFISNTRFLFLWHLPTYPAPLPKNTYPPTQVTLNHARLSLLLCFFIGLYLCLSSTQLPTSRCLVKSYSYFRPNKGITSPGKSFWPTPDCVPS